jgi:hypothetical protein
MTSDMSERTVRRLAAELLVVENDNRNQTTTNFSSPLKDRLPQRPPSIESIEEATQRGHALPFKLTGID